MVWEVETWCQRSSVETLSGEGRYDFYDRPVRTDGVMRRVWGRVVNIQLRDTPVSREIRMV